MSVGDFVHARIFVVVKVRGFELELFKIISC